MQIRELAANEDALIGEVASMLIEGFRESAPEAFPDLQNAIGEVRESFAADRITRVAVDDHGKAVGWIGGIRHYNGHT